MSILSKAYFHDEAAAFAKLESIVWPTGAVCPHCGNAGKIYDLKGVRSKPSKKHPEGVERHGLKKCAECRKQFTVRVGTVFESSHIPLHKWLQAAYLLASSKKGVSAHQLHRALELTYKSAWFMCHRLREAMRSGDLAPFGSNGGAVEIDETFIGRDKSKPVKQGYEHKFKVLSLVDRETGQARSMVVDSLRIVDLMPILEANIAKEAHVMTDEAGQYRFLGKTFAAHGAVRHKDGEYGRGPIHTNTVEGFYSIFKRGMKGVYQHCSKEHLHRYVAEYDFRYNHRSALGVEDRERTDALLSGISGKRLTYRGPDSQEV
jgi:transposase-like protein